MNQQKPEGRMVTGYKWDAGQLSPSTYDFKNRGRMQSITGEMPEEVGEAAVGQSTQMPELTREVVVDTAAVEVLHAKVAAMSERNIDEQISRLNEEAEKKGLKVKFY